MEYKNTVYNESGTIDCEVNHPRYGWIPTTLSPDDPETSALYEQINVSGNVLPYDPVYMVDGSGVIAGRALNSALVPNEFKAVSEPPSLDHTWSGTEWVAPPYEPSPLDKPRFEYMLAKTGFGEVWDDVASFAKAAGDTRTFATLAAERSRSTFRFDVTMSAIQSLKPIIDARHPDVDLSEATIKAAWKEAEAFGGIAKA